jgi:hypothetical protein
MVHGIHLQCIFYFLNVVEMNEGMGQILPAPGGLFEFVVLPIRLVAKGFKSDIG